MSRFIHLLYVPTMNCNMRCRYCYLGENTLELPGSEQYLETLRYAVDKLLAADVIPFNISLHGGEVTTLSPDDFRSLVAYISEHYERFGPLLRASGFKVGRPHIKTNLLRIEPHMQVIRDYQVSISGSLDLPLSMHDSYRLTKGGKGTKEAILHSIRLLEELPNRKKVSATIFQEHFTHLDEIVQDIRWLDENTCLDMNEFNFMIGFIPQDNAAEHLTALNEDSQVALYERMKAEFTGTHLESGLQNAWFAEFGPAYCTNCDNCGEKFFLLERNGDIYSCVRGQGHEAFWYGNIFRDSVEDILRTAQRKIFEAHHRHALSDECAKCSYLHLCKTGCPFVKGVYDNGKSYTCRLQQVLYKDQQHDPIPDGFAYSYALVNHPEQAEQLQFVSPPANSLPDLINRDPKLQSLYAPDAFLLHADGMDYPLHSQILKMHRDMLFLSPESNVRLYVKEGLLDVMSDYPVNNALWIILLTGDTVVYGDEQRNKQEHVMTHQVYNRMLAQMPSDRPGFSCIDLMPLLRLYGPALSKTQPNNLFFTTTALRDYHYLKQRENAYYHLNAMNLPFPNIELFYIDQLERS